MSALLHARTLSPLWRAGLRQGQPQSRPTPDNAPAPSQSHTVLHRTHAPVQLEFEFRRAETTPRAHGPAAARPVTVVDTD
jgi:hypothetical protein